MPRPPPRLSTRQADTVLLSTLTLMAQPITDPLDHDVRERIYQTTLQYPGLHLSGIARHANIGTNHAKHHLQVLQDEGYVSSRRGDSYWRFYPREETTLGKREILDAQDKTWLSLLRRPIPLKTTLYLLNHDEATATDLQNALDVAGSTVHYHTSKMEDADLLQSEKHGRARIYTLTDHERTQQLLARYQPSHGLDENPTPNNQAPALLEATP